MVQIVSWLSRLDGCCLDSWVSLHDGNYDVTENLTSPLYAEAISTKQMSGWHIPRTRFMLEYGVTLLFKPEIDWLVLISFERCYREDDIYIIVSRAINVFRRFEQDLPR